MDARKLHLAPRRVEGRPSSFPLQALGNDGGGLSKPLLLFRDINYSVFYYVSFSEVDAAVWWIMLLMAGRRKRKLCKLKSTEEVHERPMPILTGKLVEQVDERRTRIQSKLGSLEEVVQRNTKDMPTKKRSCRRMVKRKDCSKDETPIAPIGSSAVGTRKSLRKSSVDKIQKSPPTISNEKKSKKHNEASTITPAAKHLREETPIAPIGSSAVVTRKSLRKSFVDKISPPPPVVPTEKVSRKPNKASTSPILRSNTPPLESLEKSQKAPKKSNSNPAISKRKSHRSQSLEVENLENITIGDGNLVVGKEEPKEVVTPIKESTERNTRGPTKLKTLAIDIDNRFEVKFNSRGPLVREFVPVTIRDWRKVAKELKDILWNYVTTNDSANKEVPSRVDVWTKAHKKKNGESVNSDAAKTFEFVEEHKKYTTVSSSTTNVNEDILSKVLGPEKSSCVRAYGRRVAQTKLTIGSMKDGRVTNEKMIHMEYIIQLEDRYKELKERMSHMDQLIHSLMKNQTVEQSNNHVPADKPQINE
ncbi:hypothetical protein G4B88_029886 [Cannabis sativa]|uniref:Uncharacterized protein n=1 Tax=Cannabis sativa TaxID=3483 RepID=A0A7J6DM50_CANSA|nr:hypothetical protein G4B88_029886 [Cannabis sativa]